MMAEYIMATAVDCVNDVRMEWDNYDVLTKDGIRVDYNGIPSAISHVANH